MLLYFVKLSLDFIVLAGETPVMRSYKQNCGLAKALDVVGDRWTLLIVRELLIRGACRYTDLRNGLPGVATNLLSDRLRELEEAGVVLREEAPPPIATTLYRLTERGLELEGAVLRLGGWGAGIRRKPVKGERLQPHWLVLPLRLFLMDTRPEEKDAQIEIRVGGETITIAASKGTIDVRLGTAARAAAVVTGKPETVLQLFTGRIDLGTAVSSGTKWQGPAELLHRVAKPMV
jgi:DNA-binding HxlR family transcriptional regulator